MTQQAHEPASEAAHEDAAVARRYFGSFAQDYHRAFAGTGHSLLHRTINRLFRRRTFERRTADVERILRAHGVEGREVLDVGCGSGEVSLVAARLGARVTGLDIVEEMVRIATAEAAAAGLSDRAAFRVHDVVDGALPAADVSLLVGVVEYYRDPEPLLARVADATRELVVVVDTRGPWWRRTLRYGLAALKRFNLHYHHPERIAGPVRARGFAEVERVAGHSYTVFAFRRSV